MRLNLLLFLFSLIFVTENTWAHKSKPKPKPETSGLKHEDYFTGAKEDPDLLARIKEAMALFNREEPRNFYQKLQADRDLRDDFFAGKLSPASLRLNDDEFTLLQILAIQNPRIYDATSHPAFPFEIDLNVFNREMMETLVDLRLLPKKGLTYLMTPKTFDPFVTYFGGKKGKPPLSLHLIGFEQGVLVRATTLPMLLEKFQEHAEGLHLKVEDEPISPPKTIAAVLKTLQRGFEKRHFTKLKTLHLTFPFKTQATTPKLRLSHEGALVAALVIQLLRQIKSMEDVSLFFQFVNDKDMTHGQPIWFKLEKFTVSPDQYLDQKEVEKLKLKEDPMPALYHYRLASPMGYIETESLKKFRRKAEGTIRMLDGKSWAFKHRRDRKRSQKKAKKKEKPLSKKEVSKRPVATEKPQKKMLDEAEDPGVFIEPYEEPVE